MLREYYRLREQAQLPKIRFYDLRHSAATILKMAGIPDQASQKLLGHASWFVASALPEITRLQSYS
jgi:integrase